MRHLTIDEHNDSDQYLKTAPTIALGIDGVTQIAQVDGALSNLYDYLYKAPSMGYEVVSTVYSGVTDRMDHYLCNSMEQSARKHLLPPVVEAYHTHLDHHVKKYIDPYVDSSQFANDFVKSWGYMERVPTSTHELYQSVSMYSFMFCVFYILFCVCKFLKGVYNQVANVSNCVVKKLKPDEATPAIEPKPEDTLKSETTASTYSVVGGVAGGAGDAVVAGNLGASVTKVTDSNGDSAVIAAGELSGAAVVSVSGVAMNDH